MRELLARCLRGARRRTRISFRVLAVRALLALWFVAGGAAAETLSGVVFVVIDGDTVLFRPDSVPAGSRAFLKLRLADIDAPEKDQPHGGAATRALKALVLDQRVEVDTVATDAYGRKVARVRRGGVQVNTELVRQGNAWALSRYRRNADLLAAQHAARRAQRGLWQEAKPTPPWVWRRSTK